MLHFKSDTVLGIVTKMPIWCSEPSIPTPGEFKNFSLSRVDQYYPPIHVPLVLFYPAKKEFDIEKMFGKLKESLSETLTCFYPLGGRINDSQVHECNDKGVEYVETRVGGDLNQIINCPRLEELNQLVPCDTCTGAMGSAPLLAIQVNKFDCGGVAITMCISHKIADAATMCTFMNGWAKTARGSSKNIVLPQFDAASLFPPRQVSSLVIPTGTSTRKVVGRRFVFDASKVSVLKAKAVNTSYVERPTRVESIVALIWRCALKASKDRLGFMKPSSANLYVNLREKLNPPLPEHSFGNLLLSAITSVTPEIDLQSLVWNLREAKRELDEDYLQKLPADSVLGMCQESLTELHKRYFNGEVELYSFSSWCRFPFYEADFGWGKPIWGSCVNSLYKNVIVLMDTKGGDGIEAWVNLDEQDMARFECDDELLAYACPSQAITA